MTRRLALVVFVLFLLAPHPAIGAEPSTQPFRLAPATDLALSGLAESPPHLYASGSRYSSPLSGRSIVHSAQAARSPSRRGPSATTSTAGASTSPSLSPSASLTGLSANWAIPVVAPGATTPIRHPYRRHPCASTATACA